jgi:hypothetical protein
LEIVGVLRILLRHRHAVAAGALLAGCLGAFLLYSARPHTTGYAASRVLINAPHAPATDLDSEVAGTLAPRASLVADLMATESARTATALGAGIEPSQVAIFGPAAGAAPTVPVQLAVRATEAARAVREPYVLSVVADSMAPTASLTATGPDANVAARIVNAAVVELQTVVARRDPTRSQIQVERVGSVVAGPVVKRSSRGAAVIAAGFVFILWCGAIVVVAGLVRHRRLTGSPTLRPVSP